MAANHDLSSVRLGRSELVPWTLLFLSNAACALYYIAPMLTNGGWEDGWLAYFADDFF